jgi:hypothetical protein
LANDKLVPLTYIRDELGHANISTTSLYLNTDAKQRQKVVSEAFWGGVVKKKFKENNHRILSLTTDCYRAERDRMSLMHNLPEGPIL